MTLLIRALLAWFILAVVMFTNGAVRALVLQPRLGEQLARQVATGTGVLIIFACALVFVRRLEAPSTRELLGIVEVNGTGLIESSAALRAPKELEQPTLADQHRRILVGGRFRRDWDRSDQDSYLLAS